MHRQHVSGAAHNAKGAIKHTTGRLMRGKRLRRAGKSVRAGRSTHKALPDVKHAAQDALRMDDRGLIRTIVVRP